MAEVGKPRHTDVLFSPIYGEFVLNFGHFDILLSTGAISLFAPEVRELFYETSLMLSSEYFFNSKFQTYQQLKVSFVCLLVKAHCGAPLNPSIRLIRLYFGVCMA